jgi:hypothetical protein
MTDADFEGMTTFVARVRVRSEPTPAHLHSLTRVALDSRRQDRGFAIVQDQAKEEDVYVPMTLWDEWQLEEQDMMRGTCQAQPSRRNKWRATQVAAVWRPEPGAAAVSQ